MCVVCCVLCVVCVCVCDLASLLLLANLSCVQLGSAMGADIAAQVLAGAKSAKK